MTVLDWDQLTDGQRRTLLLPRPRKIDVECVQLGFDLTEQDAVPIDNTTGDIQWDSTATVHRDCQITLPLATELAWGIAQVQIVKTYTDLLTGLAARRARGVFCLTAPDKALGAKILNPASLLYDQIAYPVIGQDRLYLLDRQIGYSYWLPLGGDVLSLLRQVFTDAGIPASTVLIDGTRSGATLPADAVFAWVSGSSVGDSDSATTPGATTSAGGDPDLADAANPSGPYTWLQVVNYLLQLIGYRAVWCDNQGRYRCGPYVDPVTASPSYLFDANTALSTVAMSERTISRNAWAAPNSWTGVWQNMPPDSGGNSVTPSVDNGGLLTLTNPDTGLSSITARNGLVWPISVQITAASADDFAAQLAARKATDMRVQTTYAYSTRQFPEAEHYDVFTLADSDADNGGGKVQSIWWQEPIGVGDTQWKWVTI